MEDKNSDNINQLIYQEWSDFRHKMRNYSLTYLRLTEGFGGVVSAELAALRVPGGDGISHVCLVSLEVPVFEQHQVFSSVLPVTGRPHHISNERFIN